MSNIGVTQYLPFLPNLIQQDLFGLNLKSMRSQKNTQLFNIVCRPTTEGERIMVTVQTDAQFFFRSSLKIFLI
jgi:hypothetical protein